MHLKVFVKLKKTLKTLSSGQKNPKKPKKPKKTPKNPKKPTGLGFFKKTRVFSNPVRIGTYLAQNAGTGFGINESGSETLPATLILSLIYNRHRLYLCCLSLGVIEVGWDCDDGIFHTRP